MKSVSDDKFSALRQHFHNLRTVILTACNCSTMEFPVSLIKELRIQGTVRSKLELDKIMWVLGAAFWLVGKVQKIKPYLQLFNTQSSPLSVIYSPKVQPQSPETCRRYIWVYNNRSLNVCCPEQWRNCPYETLSVVILTGSLAFLSTVPISLNLILKGRSRRPRHLWII